MSKNYVKFFDAVALKPVDNVKEVKDFYTAPQNQGKGLRVRAAATHSGKITRNNGFYLPHKMRAGASSFVAQYRKPVQVHHGDEVDPVGRILEANYVDISGALHDSVKDSVSVASANQLKDFVAGHMSPAEVFDYARKTFINDKAISTDPDYQGLGYIELVADITDPDAIAKVLDGRYLTGSVGATTNAAVCSVCKNDWAKDGKCEHTPGQVYDDAKCVLIAGDLSYDEWSFVNKPADRHSQIIEVNVGGISDFVTIGADKKVERIPEITLVVDQTGMSVETGPGPEDGHTHMVTLDDSGNGTTTRADGHTHPVVNFIVQEADGHTHELPEADEMERSASRPTVQQNSIQEDKSMTFKDALELVSKIDFFKDLEGLEDAVKAVLDNKELEVSDETLPKLVADQLGKSEEYAEAFPVQDKKEGEEDKVEDKADDASSEDADKAKDSADAKADSKEDIKDEDQDAKDKVAQLEALLAQAKSLVKEDSAEDSKEEPKVQDQSKEVEELKAQVSDLEAQLKDALKKLEASRKTAKYLTEDIEGLQDALADAQVSVRNEKVARVQDMMVLSGDVEDIETAVKDLADKSSDEIDATLKDYSGKVDVKKISDNLKSGIANNAQGTVQDPTLVADQAKAEKPELTRETLDSIKANVIALRLQPGGQQRVAQYLEDCKRQGIIPSEYPVQDA